MATTTNSVEYIAKGVVRWVADNFTVSGDVSNVFDGHQFPDKTVYIKGMPGGTTNIVIEGSNDPTAGTPGWTGIVDPQGNALSFTADGIEAILEAPQGIRARLNTITSGATSPQVIIVGHANLG